MRFNLRAAILSFVLIALGLSIYGPYLLDREHMKTYYFVAVLVAVVMGILTARKRKPDDEP